VKKDSETRAFIQINILNSSISEKKRTISNVY